MVFGSMSLTPPVFVPQEVGEPRFARGPYPREAT